MLSDELNIHSVSTLAVHAIKRRYQEWSQLVYSLMINRTSRKVPGQSSPPKWDLCGLSLLHKQQCKEAQLLSHLASIREKCLPCYHLGDRWAPQAGSKNLNVDMGQEQSHLIIEIHCDHETYFGEKKNVYSLINSHDP